MGIFNRTEAASPEPTSNVQTDVPPDLAPFYADTDPSPVDILERVRDLANEEAGERVRSKSYAGDVTASMHRDMRAAEADDVLKNNYQRLSTAAEHQLRLEAAVKAKSAADHRLSQRTAFEAMHTCRICGQFDPRRIGFVTHRDLMDERGARAHHTLASCYACFNEAQQQMREAAAADLVGGGITRAELIRRMLAGEPTPSPRQNPRP